MKRFITRTRLLGLLVCLLPLSVSAGDVDGKSLVCKHKEDIFVFGFRFIDGNVFAEEVEEVELKYLINPFGDDVEDRSYKSSRSSISWFRDWWVLDRKTLELTTGRDKVRSRYECEVFESFDDYHDKLVEIQSEKQRQLEDEMQDNKI